MYIDIYIYIDIESLNICPYIYANIDM